MSFTRIGTNLWAWDRLLTLEPIARFLWVVLYTAKNAIIPGLWKGSIVTMAHDAGMPIDETARCLDILIDHELVEFDAKARVLRMIELPDAGEWPSNPAILRSWWNKFHDLPECGVRDAHVVTLRWLIDRGAREASKNALGKPSLKHEEAWAETFSLVQIPPTRRRGVRRMAELNDTSTPVQASLFALTEEITPPKASSAGSRVSSLSTGEADSVENMKSNKITVRETLVPGSGEGEGEGEGAGSDLSSLRGGSGEISTARPVLTLVPPPGAFTAADLHAVLARTGARWPHALSTRDEGALAHAIGELGTAFDGAATLSLLREHIARGGMGGITLQEICRPGALGDAIEQAQARKRNADERAAMLAAALEAAK